MKIEQKLAEWQEAGVIDAGTAARIAAHEKLDGEHAQRPYLLYAVGGLGALSVGIGLLSIVASNWDVIPAGVKLGLDLVLLLALAAGIHRVHRPGSEPGPGHRRWIAEILIFVFYGAVLASIGLVAQVYHLGGDVEDALIFWSLITAPIVLHGNGRFLAAVWLVGVESVGIAQMVRMLDRHWHRQEDVVALTVALLLSLGLCALGQWAWFREKKPGFASVAGVLGPVQLVALASLVPLVWYGYEHDSAPGVRLGAICLLGVLASAGTLAARHPARGGPAATPLFGLALAVPVVCYAPLLVDHDKSGFTAALSFLVLWSGVGFTAYRLGRFRLLNVATAFLGLRLLVIYFEVFGSLLDTGIGLLTGGLLTILLAWAWVKKTRQWSPPKPPPVTMGDPERVPQAPPGGAS